MSNGGKGDDRRPQFADDAIVTANWARIAGHADGCTVTREWKPGMACCVGRNGAKSEDSPSVEGQA
jgi:hypothetical protein